MDAIAELQRQLAAAQSTRVKFRLSERSVIDLVREPRGGEQ